MSSLDESFVSFWDESFVDCLDESFSFSLENFVNFLDESFVNFLDESQSVSDVIPMAFSMFSSIRHSLSILLFLLWFICALRRESCTFQSSTFLEVFLCT